MIPETAETHYKQQQRISVATAAGVRSLWRRMGNDFDSSWSMIQTPMLQLVSGGQLAAATNAVNYLPKVLYQTGQVDLPVADVAPEAFAGRAADGRPLGSLLHGAVSTAKSRIGQGASLVAALTAGRQFLDRVILSEIADAARLASAASITTRPAVGGYVRMLNMPSCKDCITLAGKWFRWNQGFERHPRCDCRHIPASENVAGSMLTDPYAAFNSLSKADQERLFGRIEARAIRDGADIYRVVNVGNRGLATARGVRLYGAPSRMTVDDIYRVAGTRTNAIKLMTEHGYITGPQVAGGNIVGIREGFGALGKGGRARAASDAVLDARASGVRDPLNRYTMTAAERRLYDADYRLNYVRETGNMPRSIGLNSADKYSRPVKATAADVRLIEAEYAKQVASLAGDPVRGIKPAAKSVHELARRLGIE